MTMNKTDSRLAALREVEAGRINYEQLTGTFRDGGEEVSGARRRTFAELRAAGAIEGGNPVALTEGGKVLLKDWGVD
jgi:hypothetical protein